MKRCPTCRKTYEDSMRFCQIDGTTLIEESDADQLKTLVGGAPIQDDEEDLLQLPDASDNTKTLISPSGNFGRDDAASKSLDSNPLSDDLLNQSPPFNNSPNSPPVSPFDENPPSYQPPPFKEPEQTKTSEPNFGASSQQQSPFNESPFDQSQNSFGQPMQQSSWTPPPAPEANWQNQNIGANTPFQPPAAIGGQNQTLPIISLVCGVLGFVTVCCYGGIPFGLAALIIGFIGIQNVGKDSMNYTGKNLAIGGMALGGIAFVLNVIFLIVGVAFSTLGNLTR